MDTEIRQDLLDLLTTEGFAAADIAPETDEERHARLYPPLPRRETIACPRCGGNGTITHYSHIANGQCFRCGGSGRIYKPFNAK